MDALDGQVTPPALELQIRKEHLGADQQTFRLDVAFEVPAGFTVLFGPSGAGKSTLLDCVAGLLRPDGGRIALGSEVLFDSSDGTFALPERRRVAYVFQSLALFPHLTVEENVAYGLADLPVREKRARVAQILEGFHVPGLAARKPAEISGGEKQRVALARSLVTSPRVLLLDEPLTGLDLGLKSAILDDLHRWNAANAIPILYVTHNRDEVEALGERVVAMDQGRIVREGSSHLVLDTPRHRRLAIASGFENLLAGTVLDLREADGVMRVRLAKVELEVPLGHAQVGDQVRVAIRAGDILVATEKPHGLSARNVLEGKIFSLDERGSFVLLRVDCGDLFQVQVTRGAARTLELSIGARVWVLVKTHSCHLVQD
jgi:molybdate transport system ATP-binding protein